MRSSEQAIPELRTVRDDLVEAVVERTGFGICTHEAMRIDSGTTKRADYDGYTMTKALRM